MLGRRGAGKSSLCNALLGTARFATDPVQRCTAAEEWFSFDNPDGAWWCADTPPHDAPELQGVLRVEPPDVALVLVPSTEVDAAVAGDISRWRELLEGHGGVAVVGVVTRADELAPPDGAFAPWEGGSLGGLLARSVAVFRGHLWRGGLSPVAVLPVRVDRPDEAWNLGALRARLGALRPAASALYARRQEDLRGLLSETARAWTDLVASAMAERASRGLLAAPQRALAERALASAVVSLASRRTVLPEAVPGALLGASSVGARALDALRRIAGDDASAALLAQRVRALGRILYGLERPEP